MKTLADQHFASSTPTVLAAVLAETGPKCVVNVAFWSRQFSLRKEILYPDKVFDIIRDPGGPRKSFGVSSQICPLDTTSPRGTLIASDLAIDMTSENGVPVRGQILLSLSLRPAACAEVRIWRK